MQKAKQNPAHSQMSGLQSQAEAITQSNFPLKTQPRAPGCLLALTLSPKSRYPPADQTAVTPIVTAN